MDFMSVVFEFEPKADPKTSGALRAMRSAGQAVRLKLRHHRHKVGRVYLKYAGTKSRGV